MTENSLSVAAAVQRDLDEIAVRDSALAESGLAAASLELAKAMDSPKNSATSKAQCAKSLRENLDRLRDLAPEAETKDGIDAANADRARRRKRKAKAKS